MTTGGGGGLVWDETVHSDLTRLCFSIPKPVPFKKLNRVGWVGKDGKIPKFVSFTFNFCFYFIFIILKLIYFIKNRNIMNFYKLFIKKHSNNNFYYLY